jgi:hypothetical protein
MSCGIKILSNNLLDETVFVSVKQGDTLFNLGEKTIPFMVYEIPGSNLISGIYNLYSSTYKKNYELIVPNLVNILPCITPTPTITTSITPTNTESPTPTLSPSITPTPTLSPTITPTPTLSPTITPTPTLSPTITPTPTLTSSITQSITNTPTPSITISVTNTPTPTPSITPTTPLVCNTLIDYHGPEVYPYISFLNIGYTTNTTTTFEYSAYTVADRFILYYDNVILLDTGHIGSFVYDYDQMYRENFTEHLAGKIDPITNLEYPNINVTNSAPDGYPFVNPINEGLFSFVKTSTTEVIKIEVYSCAPLNIWTFKLNCPV